MTTLDYDNPWTTCLTVLVLRVAAAVAAARARHAVLRLRARVDQRQRFGAEAHVLNSFYDRVRVDLPRVELDNLFFGQQVHARVRDPFLRLDLVLDRLDARRAGHAVHVDHLWQVF